MTFWRNVFDAGLVLTLCTLLLWMYRETVTDRAWRASLLLWVRLCVLASLAMVIVGAIFGGIR